MKLSELLEELRVGILHDDSALIAGDSDQLWPDAALTRYINEAQRRFALKALVLRDTLTIQLAAGQDEYPLEPNVISVISAKYAGDNADLARAGHSQFDTYHSPDTYFWDPSQLSTLSPGKIVAWSSDEYVSDDGDGRISVVMFRAYPVPAAPYTSTVRLRVVRLPEDLVDADDECELPQIHHIEMLDWAAYLALRTVDLDEGAPARALEFRQSFEQHVDHAKKVLQRKTQTPAQWGFGRGFAYTGN